MHTTTTATPARRAPAPRLASLPLWLTGGIAGLAASAATELYGLAAGAVGIPMSAGNIGSHTAEPITVGMFAMGTLICTFWGTVLALILARRALHPARAFARATIALTALSLASPLAAGGTAISTKLMLALAHLLAAAIVIPIITRRLTHAPGKNGPR